MTVKPAPRRAEGEHIMGTRRTSDLRSATLCGAVLIGLLASNAAVWHGSSAAFAPAKTSTTGNTWASGTITLTDNDGGTAMFNAGDLLPGSSGDNCLTVTYSGTIPNPQAVKVFAASVTDPSGIGSYLDLVVQEGSGGGFGDCTGFAPSASLYTGTFADFSATKTSYDTGVGTWLPTPSTSKVYRFAFTLKPTAPSGLQGAAAQMDLSWQTRA